MISLMIPAYNEADNLGVLLPKIKDELNALSKPYEIYVLDASSSADNSKAVCINHNVSYIRVEDTTYGSAVRKGISIAKYDKLMFMDADCSHDPKYIKELYAFSMDYDIVIASRYVHGGDTENNAILVVMSKLVNLFYKLLFRISAIDVSTSYKMYNAKDVKKLTLTCTHFDIIEEILVKLSVANNNIKIKEIPILFKKRAYGKSKRKLFVSIVSFFITALKLLKYKISAKKQNSKGNS